MLEGRRSYVNYPESGLWSVSDKGLPCGQDQTSLVVFYAKKCIRYEVFRRCPPGILFGHVLFHPEELSRIADGHDSPVVQLVDDLYPHVWIADEISLPYFSEGLQIKMIFIANASDGHGMWNQIPSVGLNLNCRITIGEGPVRYGNGDEVS